MYCMFTSGTRNIHTFESQLLALKIYSDPTLVKTRELGVLRHFSRGQTYFPFQIYTLMQ